MTQRLVPMAGLDPLLPARVASPRSGGRGHRHGADRPQEPGLRGHRGDPAPERSVRRRRRGDPLRDLRHLPPDLHGAELGVGRRCRGCRAGCRALRRARRRDLRRRHHPGLRRSVRAPRRVQDGLDRPVPLARGGHRLPVRGGDRRRHRRASQAHGHRRQWRQLVPGAALVVRQPGRDEWLDVGRGRHRPGRRLRAETDRAACSRRPRAGRRRAARQLVAGPRGARVSLWSARSRAACPPSRFPTSA